MADEQEVLISLENLKEYHEELLDMLPGEIWIGNGDPSFDDETQEEQIFGLDTQNGQFYYRKKDDGSKWSLFNFNDKSQFISTIERNIKYKDEIIRVGEKNSDKNKENIFLSKNADSCKIKISWTCTVTDDLEDPSRASMVRTRGNVEIYVKGTLKDSFKLYSSTEKKPSETEKNLLDYLQEGDNSIEIKITDDYGGARSAFFNINIISLKISGSTFSSIERFFQEREDENGDKITEGDMQGVVRVTGTGRKKIHVLIDGVERRSSIINEIEEATEGTVGIPRYEKRNEDNEDDTSKRCHGSYFVEIYVTSLEVEDEKEQDSIRSNSLYFDVIWIDNINKRTDFIIASPFWKEEMLQYERIEIPYYIYRGDAGATCLTKTSVKYINSNGEEIIVSETDYQKQQVETLLTWTTGFNEVIEENKSQEVFFRIDIANDKGELQDFKEYRINVKYRAVPDIQVVGSDINDSNSRLGINFIPTYGSEVNGNTELREKWQSMGKCSNLYAQFGHRDSGGKFDWDNGGWTIVDNRTALKMVNGSQLCIPYAIFNQSFINNTTTAFPSVGLTIEVDVSFSDVVNYDVPFFSCFDEEKKIGITISPSQATITDGINSATTYYEKSQSKRYSNSMHFTFIITKQRTQEIIQKNDKGEETIVSTNYLGGMYIYINGVGAAAQVYKATDSNSTKVPNQFSHNKLAYFNSNECTLNLFGFRMYYMELTTKQIVDNWIADMEPADKLEAYFANNILGMVNGNTDISYDKIKDTIPHMIITSLDQGMPKYKGNKVKVNIDFTDPKDNSLNFSLKKAQIDVQGTSSQYYPVKNWKFKKKDENFIVNGKEQETYAIGKDQIPSTVFCLKADYMETSSTHNTVTANIANAMYDKTDKGKTPPQRKNEKVRTTIYGRPILVFYVDSKDENPTPVFGGKYNFNYDKDSEEVFGFVPPPKDSDEYINDFEVIECVEFKENRDKKGLFWERFINPNPDDKVDGLTKDDQQWIDVSEKDSFDQREILDTKDNQVLIPYWAKAFEFRAYNRNPIYKGNDADYDVEDDKKPNNKNTTSYRRAYLQTVADWVYDLNAKSAPNTKLNKEMEFDKGAAYYEYDLKMNKVYFKHTRDNADKPAQRSSLDLGSKIPQELDYAIEAYYGVQYLKQENSNGEITEKDVLDLPKIFTKKEWEKKILEKNLENDSYGFLDFDETEGEYINISYNIDYINKFSEEEKEKIYTQEYTKEFWDSFSRAFESPEEIQYQIQTYIEIKNNKTDKIETYTEEAFQKKWPSLQGVTEITVNRKYYKVDFISPILGEIIHSVEYSTDDWQNLASIENIKTEISKIYTVKYLDKNGQKRQMTLSKDDWEEMNLDSSKISLILNTEQDTVEYENENHIELNLSIDEKNKIKAFIKETEIPDSTKKFVQKVRIYYALPWVPNNQEDYSVGKEVYRFNKDSRNYRLSRFKSEFSEHFNEHYCLMYFLLMELLGMVDSSTKNMFWATWGERHPNHANLDIGDNKKDYNVIWYPIFYDMDTMLGIDNVGKMEIPYSVEYDTVLSSNGEHAYNGYGNVFWENFRASYIVELSDTFKDKINDGTFNLSRILNQYENHSFNYPEVIYNRDGELKILDKYFTGYDVGVGEKVVVDENGVPKKDENGKELTEVITEKRYADWMHVYQGDRYYHRNFWFPNRFNYICSKNRAGSYVDDYISMRLNDPRLSNNMTTKPPEYDFDIETWTDQYVRIKYGSFSIAKRFFADTPDTINSPQDSYNDTETAIYGASNIKSIGNLAYKYANSIKLDRAIKLLEFNAGSDDPNYENNSLKNVSFGSNTMLKKINLANCRSLDTDIALGGCIGLEELILKNTQIKQVTFPAQGKIKKLILPNSILNFTITNQNYLSEFEMDKKENEVTGEQYYGLNTLKIDNVPFLNHARQIDGNLIPAYSQQIAESAVKYNLNSLTLKGIDWVLDNEQLLLTIMEKGKRGELTSSDSVHQDKRPVLHGKCTIKSIPQPLIEKFDTYFNEVDSTQNIPSENKKFELIYDPETAVKDAYTILFYNSIENEDKDGEEIEGELLNSGISGDYVVSGDPIIYNNPEGDPKRENKWDRDFIFLGWKERLSNGELSEDYKKTEELPKASKNTIYVAHYQTVYKTFTFNFKDINGNSIDEVKTIKTNGNKEISINFEEWDNKLSNLVDEDGTFGQYFLGWQIIKGTTAVCTIYKGQNFDFNYELWNEGNINNQFICNALYTQREPLCVISFKDKNNDYVTDSSGKTYERLSFFIDKDFPGKYGTFERRSTLNIPIPQEDTELFFHQNGETNYYFKGWAAVRTLGKKTIIDRKESESDITQKKPVTFNDDNKIHITSDLANSTDGYELVFKPQYINRIGKYTIYYHIIYGGLGEDAEHYVDGEDFNKDLYKDFVVENVSYRSNNFYIPDLEEDVEGKMYGYNCLGWRKGKNSVAAFETERIEHGNIQTEIWNEVYDESEIHYWVDHKKKTYTITIKYRIDNDNDGARKEEELEVKATFGNYLTDHITQEQQKTLERGYETKSETGTFLHWKWTDPYDNVEKTTKTASSLRITGELKINIEYTTATRYYVVTWKFGTYQTTTNFIYEQTITPPTGNSTLTYGATYDGRVFLGFNSNYGNNGQYLNKPCKQNGIVIQATTKNLGVTKKFNYYSTGCNGSELYNISSGSTGQYSFTVQPTSTTAWHSRKLAINTKQIFGDQKPRTIQSIKVKYTTSGNIGSWLIAEHMFLGDASDYGGLSPALTSKAVTGGFGKEKTITYDLNKYRTNALMNSDGQQYIWFGYFELSAETPTVYISGIEFTIQFHEPD